MLLKRRVELAGVWLDELDERIIISGIDEAAGKENITAVGSSAGNGQRITGRRRDTLDVTVKFQMAIKNGDMKARSELLDKVNAWASAGGWLRVGHRRNKRLMVVLVQAPGGGDMFNWTNEYTMVFRAYSLPYWSDTAYTTVQSKSKKSTTTSIDVPGNTETVADITVENRSGAKIDRISITVGESKMDFTGLAMTGTESLIIDHIHRADIYYIRARMKDGDNTRTVLQNRTGANDFYVQPGTQQVVVDADRAVQTTVSIKGRYL